MKTTKSGVDKNGDEIEWSASFTHAVLMLPGYWPLLGRCGADESIDHQPCASLHLELRTHMLPSAEGLPAHHRMWLALAGSESAMARCIPFPAPARSGK